MTQKHGVNLIKHGGRLQLRHWKLDGRCTTARAIKRLRQDLLNDLGPDVTAAQRVLVDRVTYKAINSHFFEHAIASGQSKDWSSYLTLTNSIRADLLALGLERKEREYITLTEYIENQKEGKE